MTELHSIAGKATQLAQRKGAKQCEVVVNDTWVGMARHKNKAVHQNGEGHRPIGWDTYAIKVKLIDGNNRMGVATSRSLSNIEDTVNYALKSAKVGPETKSLPEPAKITPLKGLYNEYTANLSPEERVEYINVITDRAKDHDPRISFVGGLISNVSGHALITNTLGLEAEHRFSGCNVITIALAKDGFREGSGFSRATDRDVNAIDFEAAAEEAATTAVSTMGYQSKIVTPGRYEVIFKPEAAAEYLGSIVQEALSVEREPRTTAKVPLGEQVFHESLTITDNGRDLRTLQASAFDGEGTPKKSLCLVNHGVPENRCYDNKMAKSDGTSSTGHADMPWSQYFWTGTGSGQTYLPTNQVIEPGQASYEELVSDTSEGLLVTRLRCPGSRGHTILPDTIRADTHECWFIKNGEVVGPANNFRFTDSLVNTLKDVVIGDRSTVKRVGSFVIPAVKVNSLYVSQPSLVMIQ